MWQCSSYSTQVSGENDHRGTHIAKEKVERLNCSLLVSALTKLAEKAIDEAGRESH